MTVKVDWLGHAGVRIQGSKIIYIDPWKLKNGGPADIILITHDHYDHCSPEDIAKIRKKDTIVIAPDSCAGRLGARAVKPGDKIDINGIIIKMVPAYNVDKQFHPRSNNWVGYVITIDGKTIYHSGDTDAIPEMENIKTDIAFLPVGGTYTMNAKEAARIASKMQPELAVPIHYGSVAGSRKDGEDFKRYCSCKAEIWEEK